MLRHSENRGRRCLGMRTANVRWRDPDVVELVSVLIVKTVYNISETIIIIFIVSNI